MADPEPQDVFSANDCEREPVPENMTKGLGGFLVLLAFFRTSNTANRLRVSNAFTVSWIRRPSVSTLTQATPTSQARTPSRAAFPLVLGLARL
jgi:hypothetical protein